MELLKHPLIHGDKQPSVEKTLTFIAKFATSQKMDKPEVPDKESDEDDDDDESNDVDPLLVALFEFLLKVSSVNIYFMLYYIRIMKPIVKL